MGAGETSVKAARAFVEEVLEENMRGPEALAQSYLIYEELMKVGATRLRVSDTKLHKLSFVCIQKFRRLAGM